MACLLVVLKVGPHERSRSELVPVGQTGAVEPGSPIEFSFQSGFAAGLNPNPNWVEAIRRTFRRHESTMRGCASSVQAMAKAETRCRTHEGAKRGNGKRELWQRQRHVVSRAAGTRASGRSNRSWAVRAKKGQGDVEGNNLDERVCFDAANNKNSRG